jgi:hypothetical protein
MKECGETADHRQWYFSGNQRSREGPDDVDDDGEAYRKRLGRLGGVHTNKTKVM